MPITDQGCTGCGSSATVTIDGVDGRRCADCPPGFDPVAAVKLRDRGLPGTASAYVRGRLPAGPYQPELAEHMVSLGRADAAFLYLGAYLAREIAQQFAAPIAALGGAR